jgi:hypothetical protein
MGDKKEDMSGTKSISEDPTCMTLASPPKKRGPKVGDVEDLLIAKAFIAASKDSKEGNAMRGAVFKEKSSTSILLPFMKIHCAHLQIL